MYQTPDPRSRVDTGSPSPRHQHVPSGRWRGETCQLERGVGQWMFTNTGDKQLFFFYLVLDK